jgi:hypothetical protein
MGSWSILLSFLFIVILYIIELYIVSVEIITGRQNSIRS